MCGIFGLVADNQPLRVLTNGLKDLEYRGYDSAGITYFKNKKTFSLKKVGKVDNLENSLNLNEKIKGGICHTRWATHGLVCEKNSHPQKSGSIYIVHNGIIENYLEIKEKYGFKCSSETDTEIICKLLDYFYRKYKNTIHAKRKEDKIECLLSSIKQTQKVIRGSWAVATLCKEIYGVLFVFKNQSPLIIGSSEKSNIISSDISPICNYFNSNKDYKCFKLNDYEIAKIDEKVQFFNKNLKELSKKSIKIRNIKENNENTFYKHYMQKEIDETPIALLNTYKKIITSKNKRMLELIKSAKKITFIGCGTAYHAGLIGKYYFEKFLDIKCDVILASEFRYNKNIFNKDEIVFAITQSGETADTIAGLKLAKENNLTTIVLTNVKNSSITSIADFVLFTEAGRECGVAATKTFTSQIIALFALVQKINNEKIDIKKYCACLHNEIESVKRIDFFKHLFNKNKYFFIGKGVDAMLSLEGALKLKEIAYVHSEGYPAGELKHGTLSLIDNNSLVIVIITEEKLKDKTLNSAFEAKSRGAKLLIVSQLDLKDKCDYQIKFENSDDLNCINAIIPLQYFAYIMSLHLGYDPDKPRNLAKSVTVE